MTFLYTNAQIRELEALCISEKVDTDVGLMEKAGLAAFKLLRETWPDASNIAVCCGKGNNGGDGFVLARLAHEAGLSVIAYTLPALNPTTSTAQTACEHACNAGVNLIEFQPDICIQADIIVDALLGSGLKGNVTEPYDAFISAINHSKTPVLSIDVPSGIQVDTGSELGISIYADITLTFIALTQGLFTHNARSHCGKIICDTLEIPDKMLKKVEHAGELLTWADIKPMLPRRSNDAFKNDFGHVLVIGGDYGMGGAARMAAESAMRVGAGLVSVATRPEHLSIVSGMRPEVMCHSCSTRDDLLKLLDNVTTIVVGPGLGKTDWAKELLNATFECDLPKVLDADALNLIAQDPRSCDHWILTPHPGEAGRLLRSGTAEIQEDRFQAARELQQKFDGTIVLKGSGTIIEGATDIPYVCPLGNPGMATGGMGDILSGMIGGFLAQGLSLNEAAETGVYLHSKAADLAAETKGERGLLATDVLQYLPQLLNPYMQLPE